MNKVVLLKSVKILDQQSKHHQKKVDILLEDGLIKAIGNDLEADAAQVIAGDDLHASPGWVELRANFNDPGNEDRETLESGAQAAHQGGFTAVALSPQTNPVVDHKSGIEYLRSKSQFLPVQLLPFGAFSKGLKGEELSEIYDMRSAGAIAFSNGSKPVANSALMKLALLYQRELPEALQVLSFDPAIVSGGQMHEGPKSTWLGLKGIPELGESLSMARDIALAEYTNSALHFQGVSSLRGVELIRDAQARGLDISGDVNLLNLIYTDEALEAYDSNFKVYPPLREEQDRKALIQALKDGVLKGIASDHRPRTIEEKRCEFDLAHFGAATIEASFALLNTHLSEELGLERIIHLMSHASREILNFQSGIAIEEGAPVDLTIFDPSLKWQWDNYTPKSKAANYPFKGMEFTGKVIGTFCKGRWQGL
jgi:dihydroorotase